MSNKENLFYVSVILKDSINNSIVNYIFSKEEGKYQ